MADQLNWSRETAISWRFWAGLVLLAVVFLSLIKSVGAEDPCVTCGHLVKSVYHGLEKTARSHFGGGDAAWESERLGKYATSETRFVEATEYMCKKKDVKDDLLKDMSEDKCVQMMNDVEEDLEHWYFHKQKSDADLHEWLCINKLKHCCPPNTFGPNCEDCLGPDFNRPCFGNGNCEGAGSRKGTGKCVCNPGYQGKTCRLCATVYFSVLKNDTHSVCEACHPACKTHCTDREAKHCQDCKPGWTFTEANGCDDIDECAAEEPACKKPNEECVNTPGSFSCNCKEGFKRKDNECIVDIEASHLSSYPFHLTPEQILRYAAFVGLFLAGGIIIYRRSIGLGILFLLTLLFLGYVEFGPGGNIIANFSQSGFADTEALKRKYLKTKATEL